MKTVLTTIAILLTAACGGTGGGMSTMSANPTIPQIADSATPSQVFESMLNGVRSTNGVGGVTYDARLGAAARRHANDMHANNFLEHTGSDGSTPGDRVRDEGYIPSALGENIGQGFSDEAAMLQWWVNSPDHQRNNINPRYEDFALAKAGNGSQRYWVLVLATER